MSIHGRVINRPHLIQVTCICTVNDSWFIGKYPFLFLNPFHTYEVDYSIYRCDSLYIGYQHITHIGTSPFPVEGCKSWRLRLFSWKLGIFNVPLLFWYGSLVYKIRPVQLPLTTSQGHDGSCVSNLPFMLHLSRVKSPIYATPLTRQISHLCYTSHASNLPFMLHLSCLFTKSDWKDLFLTGSSRGNTKHKYRTVFTLSLKFINGTCMLHHFWNFALCPCSEKHFWDFNT